AALAAQRAGRAQNPDDHVILTERISKEPLAPVVRHGDEEWRDIVTWVVYALIEAEEKGITQKNVDEMAKSEAPDIKRMLGTTPGAGKSLGLDEKWAYNAIKAVGNYGEIFDRHPRLAAEAGARLQQSVEQGRPDLRDADPVASEANGARDLRNLSSPPRKRGS